MRLWDRHLAGIFLAAFFWCALFSAAFSLFLDLGASWRAFVASPGLILSYYGARSVPFLLFAGPFWAFLAMLISVRRLRRGGDLPAARLYGRSAYSLARGMLAGLLALTAFWVVCRELAFPALRGRIIETSTAVRPRGQEPFGIRFPGGFVVVRGHDAEITALYDVFLRHEDGLEMGGLRFEGGVWRNVARPDQDASEKTFEERALRTLNEHLPAPAALTARLYGPDWLSLSELFEVGLPWGYAHILLRCFAPLSFLFFSCLCCLRLLQGDDSESVGLLAAMGLLFFLSAYAAARIASEHAPGVLLPFIMLALLAGPGLVIYGKRLPFSG